MQVADTTAFGASEVVRIRDHDDLVAQRAQHRVSRHANHIVVFNQKNVAGCQGWKYFVIEALPCRLLCIHGRQRQKESRALAQGAGNIHMATQLRHERSHYGQAEPGSATFRLGGEERLEDAGERLLILALPRIFHLEVHDLL